MSPDSCCLIFDENSIVSYLDLIFGRISDVQGTLAVERSLRISRKAMPWLLFCFSLNYWEISRSGAGDWQLFGEKGFCFQHVPFLCYCLLQPYPLSDCFHWLKYQVLLKISVPERGFCWKLWSLWSLWNWRLKNSHLPFLGPPLECLGWLKFEILVKGFHRMAKFNKSKCIDFIIKNSFYTIVRSAVKFSQRGLLASLQGRNRRGVRLSFFVVARGKLFEKHIKTVVFGFTLNKFWR